MDILVDADACPVKQIIERIAKEYQLPVTMFIDTSHELHSDYSKIITVSKAPDAVDFALMNRTKKGDIIVTQDYGVAAMGLGKGAYALHQSGKRYTNENIDQMLFERHLAKEGRRNKRNSLRGHTQKKRTPDDDVRFEDSLRCLIDSIKAGKENC